MGKSYAFLVLAICLSSTITSCAKTENNKTEEDFFAQENTGNENNKAESGRDFTEDFLYAIKGMDNGGSIKAEEETYEQNLETGETESYQEEAQEKTTGRTSMLQQEKESGKILFAQQALTSLEVVIIGSAKSLKM